MKKHSLLFCILASVTLGVMAERHTSMLTTTDASEPEPVEATADEEMQAEVTAESEAEAEETPDVIMPNQGRPARVRATNDNDKPQMVRQHHFDFNEYLDTKCAAVVKEMGLNAKDSAKFVPVYRELQRAKSELYRKYGGNRAVRERIDNGENVADTTLLRVVRNYAARQAEDARLEQQYLTRFEKLLTPMQLYKLQRAETTFKNDMMRRRNEASNAAKQPKPMKK